MITIKKARITKNSKEIVDNKIYFHDIEVFENYFLLVMKNRDTKDYIITEIHDKDIGEIRKVLEDVSGLIGYNCLSYDGQVIEFILRNPGCTVTEIKKFSDSIIYSKDRYPPFKLTTLSKNYLDLMEINNYGIHSAKSTSLKQLSAFFRSKSVADSPCDFNKPVKESDKPDIIKYCIKDTDDTETTYEVTLPLIILRSKFGQEAQLDFTNDSEVKLAKKYFWKILSQFSNKSVDEVKNARTYRDKIVVKDIILPYINFTSPVFKEIKKFYEGIVLTPSVKSLINPNIKCISLKKSIEKSVTINDTVYDYKAGGIHGCYKRGIYCSDENSNILDIDYESFYPKLAILNRISPAHVDVEVYINALNFLFGKRKSYDKKTNFTLNYSFKILINLIYGLSNSEFGPFYDAEYTLKTCVNGMLTISMLIERLIEKVPDLIVLQANTDGITIKFDKQYNDVVQDLIKENQQITGLNIEQNLYKKMIIYDVNNYMSVGFDGSCKQKGFFQTRDNMIKEGAYHKDPSNNIIAIALNQYYLNNISVEDTINNCNNIFEFLFVAKGSKTFKWLLNTIQPSGVIHSKLLTDRVLRYYIGGNTSISKMWLKGSPDEESSENSPSSFTLLNANSPVTLLQVVRNENINVQKKVLNPVDSMEIKVTTSNYPDLDRSYYINECYKIINNLNNPDNSITEI